MISVLLLSLLGASPPSGPDVGAAIRELRRGFIEDGADRVAATPTHRVVSRPDGSLELQGAQSLRISVESVRRSRGSSCLAAPLAREVVPGSARTIRTRRACALEETWTNEAAGLEHAFILARPPKGTGGVVLRLGVEGPWHHQDAQGHVFKGPGAADLLRYGNAFVLRDGRRLPVPVVHVGGGLELRVPRELVEAPGAFPMFIDPILSMEQALDPTLIRGPSPAQEEMPAVAVNAGGTAMVVWVDNRRQLGTDLFGARFNSTGTLVDEAGFPVATGPGHQIRPAICAQAMEFLVAWEQPGDGGQEVMACAVSSSGVPTAPQPVAMGSQPSLAAPGDAGYSLLAWVDRSSAVQVVQMRGRMAGTPYVRPPETGGATSSNPVIAASNRSWFVAWESRLGIATPIIRGMGDGLIPSALVALSNADFVGSGRPTVALGSTSNDDEAFIFWEHGPNIAGLRLTTGGPIPYPEFLGSRPSAVRTSLVQGAQPILGSLLGNSLQLRDLNL